MNHLRILPPKSLHAAMRFITQISLGLFALEPCILSANVQEVDLINQEIHWIIDKKAEVVHMQWAIGSKGFQLETKNSYGTSHFIFNGRTFYVCSKLSANQQSLVKQIASDQQLVSSVREGVSKGNICQEVPSDFFLRFFISPYTAIGTLNKNDGFKINTELTSYKRTQPAKAKNTSDCTWTSRQLTMARQNDKSKAANTKEATAKSQKILASAQLAPEQEDLDSCIDSKLTWRSLMWRELQMVLMRQPQQKQNLEYLRKDFEYLDAFTIKSRTLFTSVQNQRSVTGQLDVKTLTRSRASSEKYPFKIPSNAYLLSPKSFKKPPSNATPSKTVGQNVSASRSDFEAIIDTATSAFFCAIASGLGCFNLP